MAAKRGSRIVVVSSSAAWMGTINYDDPNFTARPYKPWPAYVQSKVANLVFAETLNEMLGTSGSPIACVSVHPGVTTTELQRHWPSVRLLAALTAMKPALGALPTAFAATAPSAEGGRFYGPDGLFGMRGYPAGAKKISRANQDAFTPENKQRLWEMSESMTGINYARTMGLRRGA
jgi:NAD(P)-dependent dehydrogenase (short-subunit alcohol dehydrogenase family)